MVREHRHSDASSEDDSALSEEALNHVPAEALVQDEQGSFHLWNDGAEAGSCNLAAHCEKSENAELAPRHYALSEEHGCSFAKKEDQQTKMKTHCGSLTRKGMFNGPDSTYIPCNRQHCSFHKLSASGVLVT